MWLWSLWPANRVTRCDTIIFRWTLGGDASDDDDDDDDDASNDEDDG